MKTITPKNIDSERVQWTGYPDGAILVSAVGGSTIDNKGNTKIISKSGRKFDCHPMVTKCCAMDENGMVNSETMLEIKEGVYPIRFEECGEY